jgi:hypothetical protein
MSGGVATQTTEQDSLWQDLIDSNPGRVVHVLLVGIGGQANPWDDTVSVSRAPCPGSLDTLQFSCGLLYRTPTQPWMR